MNNFNFVPFTGSGGKYSYIITITRNAGFGLNSGFYKIEKIKDYSHVLLSYDSKKKAIGFIFKHEALEGTLKIIHNINSGSFVSRSFFVAHNLDVAKIAKRYTPKIYEDEKIGKVYYIEIE